LRFYRLFETLDPVLRQVYLPSGREVLASDTVGFISDLPHSLISAFQVDLLGSLMREVVSLRSREMAEMAVIRSRKIAKERECAADGAPNVWKHLGEGTDSDGPGNQGGSTEKHCESTLSDITAVLS